MYVNVFPNLLMQRLLPSIILNMSGLAIKSWNVFLISYLAIYF